MYTILNDFTATQSAYPKSGLAVINPIRVVVGISQTNTDIVPCQTARKHNPLHRQDRSKTDKEHGV